MPRWSKPSSLRLSTGKDLAREEWNGGHLQSRYYPVVPAWATRSSGIVSNFRGVVFLRVEL